MARTLQQLKESVEKLIESQGVDAPVAAFIFTQEDVFELDSEGNPVHLPLDDDDIGVVLNEIETGDYIFERVFECIDDEIRRLKIAKKSSASHGESQ